MKKKKNKKLTLSSETVRHLAADDLSNIEGAGPSDNCTGNPCTGFSCVCSVLCSIRTCPP